MKYPNYETNRIEFKQELGNKIKWLKKVCGLANEVLGGTLVIGVTDDKDIVGVNNVTDVIDVFTREVKNCIEPVVPFNIEVEAYDSKSVIVITVMQGSQPPYILKENNGRHIVYVMRGSTTEPGNQNDLIQLALRATNLSWDTLKSSYKVEQLTFKSLATKHQEVLNKELKDKDLEELGLVSDGFITNLGVLFSDQNPNTDSWISVTRWPGLDKTASEGIYDKEFKGSIIDQIDGDYHFAQSLIRVEFSFIDESPQRTSTYEYDLKALREVIINAFAHRNYSVHNNQQIEVGIYDDRIEVKSNGELLNGHTVEDLVDLKTIGRRNVGLCNVLRELEYIESRGRGMLKIIEPRDSWRKSPTFVSSYNFFMATLYSQYYDGLNEVRDNAQSSLDSTDIMILKSLSSNPTITQRALSDELGISRRTLTNRLNKLYHSGIVKKEGSPQKSKYSVLVDIDI